MRLVGQLTWLALGDDQAGGSRSAEQVTALLTSVTPMDAAMQYSTAQFLVEGAGVNALLSTFPQASSLPRFTFPWFLVCTRRVLFAAAWLGRWQATGHTFSAFWL